MNWLKKGPELKLPKLRKPKLGGGTEGKGSAIKPPAVVADLYSDLRDRRLLLPLALVVVAIAAVPILLGDSEQIVPPHAAVNPAPGAGGSASASFAVVEAKPGLRDYRKRLGDRTATNPFEQRYTSLPDGAKVESSSVSSSSGGGGGEEDVAIVDVEEETGGTPPSDGGDSATEIYELVVNVQITRSETTPDGGEERGELEVRKNVPVLTQLPGKKTPVVTTMGANFETERLLFLVSNQVKSIGGEFVCMTRGDICELLEVRLGALLEFVYEPSGAVYTLKVTKVDAIPARKRRSTRSSRAVVTRSYPGLRLQAGSGSVWP